jgi:phosphocarrier protein HPr
MRRNGVISVLQNSQVAFRQVAIGDVLGLHLRTAAKFVILAQAFQSVVKVRSNGTTADGKRILDLFNLAAGCGTMLTVEAEGCDAEDAVAALANLISAQSDESEDQLVKAACESQRSRPT